MHFPIWPPNTLINQLPWPSPLSRGENWDLSERWDHWPKPAGRGNARTEEAPVNPSRNPHRWGMESRLQGWMDGWRTDWSRWGSKCQVVRLAISMLSLLSYQLGRLSVSWLPRVPVPPGAWWLPALEWVGSLPATDAGCAPPAWQTVAPWRLLPRAGCRAPQVSLHTTLLSWPTLPEAHLPHANKSSWSQNVSWVCEQMDASRSPVTAGMWLPLSWSL